MQFPPGGECWRGGGFDEKHRAFFDSMRGKKYRVPAFLPTSFRREVTNTFMFMAEAAGRAVVQWKVEVDARADPAGANLRQYLCKHVNRLRVTHVPGEAEYLFQAYSVFTVKDEPGNPHWSDSPTAQDPHRITLVAAVDNSAEAEGLPLAPWY